VASREGHVLENQCGLQNQDLMGHCGSGGARAAGNTEPQPKPQAAVHYKVSVLDTCLIGFNTDVVYFKIS
jgi:hypothetical protein